ncbi:hypothetical protein EQG49_13460 [Periweissella cryptocerci]|uniref:TraD/TraG TraM recognition site domain-containing protein n=1 Tax=Periweissella cryptocerci TaxID=2506420 RepID=A0A4V1AJ13_9LACO|nr:type IV secretory system conjugative DNA transfer family protein [Periweissella cryptocerci]QBO37405.1 hypothetical protein EQG49_13460 [Periweissella cryptocerci]
MNGLRDELTERPSKVPDFIKMNNPKVRISLYIVMAVFSLLFSLYLVTVIVQLSHLNIFNWFIPKNVSGALNSSTNFSFSHVFSLFGFVNFSLLVSKHVIIVVMLALLIESAALVFTRKTFTATGDMNYNEYGNSRTATPEEVKEQYVEIDDMASSLKYRPDDTFAGYGGVPVMHELVHNRLGEKLAKSMGVTDDFKGFVFQNTLNSSKIFKSKSPAPGKYFIDQDTVNTIVIGITRSGKGEMFVNILVDILSRAQKQASIVVTDPKGELYRMSYKTLRMRNYNVQVLNLLNMPFSMSYNPLQVAIDYARKGYVDETQEAVNAVATSIYEKPGASKSGNDAFWINSSKNLLSALILALIDIARRKEKDLGSFPEKKDLDDCWKDVTLYNAYKMLTVLGEEKDTPEGADESKSKLSIYFEKFQKLPKDDFRSMAYDNFQQSNFAGDETAGSIYSSALEGLRLFSQTGIARLTSKNSIDFKDLGFPRRFSIHFPTSKDGISVKNKSCDVTFFDDEGNEVSSGKRLVDQAGWLTYEIKEFLPDNFTVTVIFKNRVSTDLVYKFEGSKIYEMAGFRKAKLDEFSDIPVLDFVDLNLSNQLDMPMDKHPDSYEIRYSDKPTALFLVMPPQKADYNILGSFIVDQAFNQNYELALNSGGKLHNRIHFILDEFGNLPPINAMATKVSIGLGQGILFNIIIQNMEQLETVYSKENSQTIMSNAANLFYILTQSTATAEMMVKLAGKRTVTVKNRSATAGQLQTVNVSESRIGQDVIDVNQFMNFKVGEMFVSRSTHRQTLKHKNVRAYPIYDKGEYSMPSRWMFLNDFFDENTRVADIPVESLHRDLNLWGVTEDFGAQYAKLNFEVATSTTLEQHAGNHTRSSSVNIPILGNNEAVSNLLSVEDVQHTKSDELLIDLSKINDSSYQAQVKQSVLMVFPEETTGLISDKPMIDTNGNISPYWSNFLSKIKTESLMKHNFKSDVLYGKFVEQLKQRKIYPKQVE